MKWLVSFVSMVISLTCGATDQNTQRVYSEVIFLTSSSSWVGSDKKLLHTNLLYGTSWVVMTEKGPVLITAAHVLALGPRGTPKQIGDLKIGKDHKILETKRNVVFGTLAFKSQEIATFGEQTDFVLIKAEPGVYLESKQLSLSKTPVKVGDTVRIYGFPGTSHEKLQTSTVTSTYPSFFILNDPVHQGFSGGVVLNQNGEAVGMITGSEAKQSTAILINEKTLNDARWNRFLAGGKL